MEHLALDRRPFQREPKLGIQRVDARLQEGVDGWRHGEVAVALPGHGDHLLDEERVPARCGRDALTRCRVQSRSPSRLSIRIAHSAFPSGSSRSEVAFSLPPPQSGRTSSNSLRATQSMKIGASRERSATCSTRSTNSGSAHCRSSMTATWGRAGRTRLEEPSERDPRLGGRGHDDALRVDAERHEHLDERPVSDPLAVREAASAEHVRVVCDPFEEVRDEA